MAVSTPRVHHLQRPAAEAREQAPDLRSRRLFVDGFYRPVPLPRRATGTFYAEHWLRSEKLATTGRQTIASRWRC